MRSVLRNMIVNTGLPSLLAGGLAVGTVQGAAPERVALSDGRTTPCLRLDNGTLSVAVLPELGGKIVSLRTANGREFLSRSVRHYRQRTYAQPYGETEFDGIDELFPTLGACTLPDGPWRGTSVPDHGELATLPWKVVDGPGITLEVSSPTLPYGFRRTVSLEDDTLVLSYTVANTSAQAFAFTYAFHPLFVGAAGCRYGIPDDLPMTVSWSKGGWLGTRGEVRPWGGLRDEAGGRLRDAVFVPGSGRYYKLFSPRLDAGRFRLEYADGSAVELTWPADILPHYALWCSEGGVDGLHHIGIEPTTGTAESLTEALASATAPSIPPFGRESWWIRIRVAARR